MKIIYLNKILPFIVFSVPPEEPHGETACWGFLIFNFIWWPIFCLCSAVCHWALKQRSQTELSNRDLFGATVKPRLSILLYIKNMNEKTETACIYKGIFVLLRRLSMITQRMVLSEYSYTVFREWLLQKSCVLKPENDVNILSLPCKKYKKWSLAPIKRFLKRWKIKRHSPDLK